MGRERGGEEGGTCHMPGGDNRGGQGCRGGWGEHLFTKFGPRILHSIQLHNFNSITYSQKASFLRNTMIQADY